MNRLLLLMVLIGLSVSMTSVAMQPSELDLGRYHALIISNQNYKQLSPLRTPHGDADALGNLLRQDYGFKVTSLRDANRASTLDALDQLVEKLTPNDNLLIFYAGHGHLDSATGEGYWLPVTANPRRRSEWISNGDITDTLRATVAKHVLVISDSCFSGTLSRSAAAGLNVGRDKRDYFLELAKRKSRTALSSGGLEPVDDGGSSGHSVFAGALISALRRNNEPILEAESLYSQIKRPVALNSSAIQKPQYSDVRATGHDEGDFLFFKRNIRFVAKPTLPTNKTTTGSNINSQAAYELAFWDSIKDSKDARDFSAYIETYPSGQFTVLANLRIRQLATVQKKQFAQTENSNEQEEDYSSVSEAELASTTSTTSINEPKVIPRLSSLTKSELEPSKQADNILVVLATPDSEYSPKFNTIEAYSKAVAKVVTSVLKGESLLYLPQQDLALSIINEYDAHVISKQLCQQYQARGVISVELDLSRDIEELGRTPDDAFFGYYHCKTNRYNVTRYSVDFQLGESFAYAVDIRNSISQFNKTYLSKDQ